MLQWLSTNAVGLGVIGAAIAFVWSIVQFTLDRHRESRSREFEAFHRLIKELVSPDAETKSTWIDRQAAVVFELRHFPRYYEFTYRTLAGLKQKWGSDPEFKYARLMEELDLTLAYITNKKPNQRFQPTKDASGVLRD